MALLVTFLLAPGIGESETLRSHAWRVDIGAEVGGFEVFWIPGDPSFLPTIAREFSLLLLGGNLKWAAPGARVLRPSRDVYDFTDADTLVTFGEAHGMKLKAHTLVWRDALPEWLTQGTWTRDELIQILREHILTVVGRYRGRIKMWDVVNEAFSFDGSLQDSFWLRGIGPDYIELALRWAHEADPDALLFLNDDGVEGLNVGSDRFHRFVADLLARGVPLHGVGLESHVDLGYVATGSNFTARPDEVGANIKRFGELGLQVHISELDVRIPLPPTDATLAAQADVYRGLLGACQESAACTAFIIWGVTDRWSWIPGAFPGYGAALIFDEEYRPKPAYQALLDALRAVSDRCFNLAGAVAPQYIRPARPTSQTFEEYYYRHYAETDNYLATQGGRVYYYDPAASQGVLDVLSVGECFEAAKAAGF